MSTRNLRSLLRPQSIALIGASDRPGHMGQVTWRNLTQSGFAGRLYPVNPNHGQVGDTMAYPNIAALPEAPDLAVIVTPVQTVPGIVAELAEKGVKAAIIITAGFGGSEGQAMKQRMLDAARPSTLRILGPNCLGLIVPGLGVNAAFAHLMPKTGGLAFLSQSGAILTSVIDWAQPRGIGFSHLVSMGELADVDFGDMLDYLADDPETTAILMYVEAVTQARKFMSAARRAARVKPVIAIKAGRHSEAAKAVASHTGAMAGADAVYDAAFRRAGMLRVYQLDELFAAAQTLAVSRIPRGGRLAIMTNGGGMGILATDTLIDAGGRLAELAPATVEQLNAVLPAGWSHGNPVDIIGDAPPERFAATAQILRNDPNVDALLALNCPTAIADPVAAADKVIEAVAGSRLCVMTSWIGEATAVEARRHFSEAGIPTYETPEAAVRAFGHVVAYRRNREMLMETPPSMPTSFQVEMEPVRAIVDRALAEKREMLTGPEAQTILGAYHIPTTQAATAATPAEARAVAQKMSGLFAVKILSPDITHKSDIGGVTLGVDGAEAVEQAAEAIIARAKRLRPAARILGVSIEPMIRRTDSVELILGMIEDAQFGPVLLFGHGGVAVERLADSALALPPLNISLAHDLMEKTRVYRLLTGYRNQPKADIDAIALTLVKLSQLIVDVPEIVELDINPLLADQNGVVALDARMKVRPTPLKGATRLAIRPYPRRLEDTVEDQDGRAFMIRPILPEDEPEIQALIARLSPRAIRLRFFAPLKALSHMDAARLTQIDYDREMALVLTQPGPAGKMPIHAVVRLISDANNEHGEYAVVVQDDLTGKGLGMLLMKRIIEYAKTRGLGEIIGHVLSENTTMLKLCEELGFSIHRQTDDTSGVMVRLKLG
ncbi:bifunctional acetate--CoA ligase family protein/GNAT family N-acetyltransferase [Dongia sedimenti]|uniref:Bifunctional acetate--CoA ligase family protein/GNAT family N-acetyltransferase n=1 Tax=Dongia sedimenti TaxID=3064282 RepID=A0ABU0YKP2_9PROT|nr:bifunctional acetate--CoA ligase family protein/GNAT family N-acetyltransferase [Rhodospirillaceae bacterium R-7]